METIGERIKKLRVQNNWTQAELAQKMGYESRAYIAKIEGGRSISQKIVEKFASVFNVSPSYLMGWDDLPDVNNFNGLDPNDTNINDLPKFNKPTKSDAKVAATANDVAKYKALLDLLKECGWNVSKIKKGELLNGIETTETYYAISNQNGVTVNITYTEFLTLQENIYDSIEGNILDVVKEKLGI